MEAVPAFFRGCLKVELKKKLLNEKKNIVMLKVLRLLRCAIIQAILPTVFESFENIVWQLLPNSFIKIIGQL